METENILLEKSAPKKWIKIRFLAGLIAFFVVAGMQLIGNPFLYSRDYSNNIVAIIILAVGVSISLVLSLYLTERLIVKNRIKAWKILIVCVISDMLFIISYAFSLFSDLQSIGPSEGMEAMVGIMLGIIYLPVILLILFIINFVFYKLYNYNFGNKIIYSLLGVSVIFSFVMIGLKVRDYNYCNFSKDKECLIDRAVFAGDASLCLKNKYANSSIRSDCFIEVSKVSENISVCDYVKDGTIYQCYANVAFNTKNYSLCDKLSNLSYKNSCYLEIGKKTDDIGFCHKITNDSDKFSKCVEDIASDISNIGLCEYLNDKDGKGCRLEYYLSVASKSSSTEICDKIKKEGWSKSIIENCFSYVAAYSGNESLCEKVSDHSNTRDVCYLGVSRKSTNINMCDKIGYTYNAYECITNISINTGDQNLCKRAYDDYKKKCLDDFKRNEKH